MAISPELPEHSAALVEKLGLDFPILRDEGNEVGAAYGLRFEFPADLRAVYAGFGLDLAACNGEPSWTLSMPARYVIGPDGSILDARVHADYTRRPEPEEALAILRG